MAVHGAMLFFLVGRTAPLVWYGRSDAMDFDQYVLDECNGSVVVFDASCGMAKIDIWILCQLIPQLQTAAPKKERELAQFSPRLQSHSNLSNLVRLAPLSPAAPTTLNQSPPVEGQVPSPLWEPSFHSFPFW